jgi:hypothetical protein
MTSALAVVVLLGTTAAFALTTDEQSLRPRKDSGPAIDDRPQWVHDDRVTVMGYSYILYTLG